MGSRRDGKTSRRREMLSRKASNFSRAVCACREAEGQASRRAPFGVGRDRPKREEQRQLGLETRSALLAEVAMP